MNSIVSWRPLKQQGAVLMASASVSKVFISNLEAFGGNSNQIQENLKSDFFR